jgi:tyrosyl-tRNA synthetase
MNFVEELKWRGMIHDIMPGTEELMLREKTAGYVGFDPTADSLHIGHLVGVMMLKANSTCRWRHRNDRRPVGQIAGEEPPR